MSEDREVICHRCGSRVWDHREVGADRRSFWCEYSICDVLFIEIHRLDQKIADINERRERAISSPEG